MTRPYAGQTEAAMRDAVSVAVDHAVALGADGVSAGARAGGGLRIVVRDGIADTALRDSHQTLWLTVFRGGRSGSASSSALDAGSIRRAADEAFAIAGHVGSDPMAGLADPDTLALDGLMPPMLAPSGLDAPALRDIAVEGEALARSCSAPVGVDLRVTEAGAASSDTVTALATSAGFCRSAATSIHRRWAMVLAQGPDGAVQEVGQTSDRRFDALDDAATVAAGAVARAVARLGGRRIPGRAAPVLFDARIAATLVEDIVGALSGGPQHRRASFLLDTLDRPVAPVHLDLTEDPFEPWGMASGGFDGEGVAGRARSIIAGGVVQGYLLATASARRLGMRSTGNADGPWNLRLTSSAPGGDAAAMRGLLHTGLIVTQLLGGATDPVSGTWTRAVEGLWVENGTVIHPVADVTLGGTMRDMMAGIVAVGDDVYRNGAIRCGSILVETMHIGGSS
ncbi:TldD/PmbA family protein [Sphingomonas sp. Leaf4]|uniref:TldD/PmbA family protein n=1 Tax=Sphingomonas sp. Leaf4 TaxID=2876553 RepID=UPI001E563BDC|nr:metallopeptidase TldD-related protein [Sphingomonas sp. Leaf4]